MGTTNEITEIRTRTLLFLGIGAINKIYDISKEFSEKGIYKVAVLTGKSAYKKTGIW